VAKLHALKDETLKLEVSAAVKFLQTWLGQLTDRPA